MLFKGLSVNSQTLVCVVVGFGTAYKAYPAAVMLAYDMLNAVLQTAFVVKAYRGISLKLACESNNGDILVFFLKIQAFFPRKENFR